MFAIGLALSQTLSKLEIYIAEFFHSSHFNFRNVFLFTYNLRDVIFRRSWIINVECFHSVSRGLKKAQVNPNSCHVFLFSSFFKLFAVAFQMFGSWRRHL